ncbi:MAG: hypothetical protein QM711_04340 [Micropruina sp.]|uniref:hypothetical protein n=1 Tax=Micropruina sp. TaxID=2737536 RepID=UPI0039E253F8
MAQSVRQEARRRVREAAALRKRSLVEREARLNDLAVEVVTAVAARDRAVSLAAEAVGKLLGERVPLDEIGQRCGLPTKELARLKRIHLSSGLLGDSSQSQGEAPTFARGELP